MTQANRYELLETSIAKLIRLRNEMLNNAELDYAAWDPDTDKVPIKFEDGSVYKG